MTVSWIENPCVDSSILSLATIFQSQPVWVGFVISGFSPRGAWRGPILRVLAGPRHHRTLPKNPSI